MILAGRNRGRWAVSFADLCLLLLGFFVLLQANAANRAETLRGLGAYFGRIEAPSAVDLAAGSLFQPGEALLSEAGQARLAAVLAPVAGGTGRLRLQSFGIDRSERRFDGWDLAAARLGAVARAARNAGIAEDRIVIAGLAETGVDAPGQTIRVLAEPGPATQ